MSEYVGIADCHGIESFTPAEEVNIAMLRIRAMANRQRLAVLYRADLTEKKKEAIERLLGKEEYQLALKILQTEELEIEEGLEEFWKTIPNPELDPWR